jgi:SpoVK/Ycf46/Vps4 family AAA+-type ATPase
MQYLGNGTMRGCVHSNVNLCEIESVAEKMKRPLYQISAGELSIEVNSLEQHLGAIFRVGARWNAIVLLDEADVLMSKRTKHDLQRNAIVAVFLRMLEHYRGMLFLTTNRHDDFDDAFYNRIHITIEYHNLDEKWRTNIWRNHIGSFNQRSDVFHEDVLQALGRVNLNGRDIKNVVRTAYALARARGEEKANTDENTDRCNLELQHILHILRNNIPGPSLPEKKGKKQLALNERSKMLTELDIITKRFLLSGPSSSQPSKI